jgi:TolB protein
LFVGQVLPFFDQYALSHRFWSPDSRAIALPIAADDGSVSIAAIPTDGGPTTRSAGGVAASWSP